MFPLYYTHIYIFISMINISVLPVRRGLINVINIFCGFTMEPS